MLSRSSFFDQLQRFRRDGRRLGGWLTGTIASLPPRPQKHPDSKAILERAFREAVAAFVLARRFLEADDLAERALAKLPDNRELLVQHALSAHNDQRHVAAAARWRSALRIAPDLITCYVGLAANLRETGDYEEAQVAIDEALRQFPQDNAVVSEAARLAACRGRYRSSLELWQRAIDAPHPPPDWLRGHVQSLFHLGAFQEADAALKAALADFPDDGDLKTLEDLLTSARADETASGESARVASSGEQPAHRNETAADELPASPAVALRDVEPPPGEPARTEDDEAVKRLLLRFESLGDTCEFGFVQRRYAAEPLGLLRWSNVTFDQLVQALEHRLAGMGEPANTHIAVATDGEYCIHDRRWSLGMHTFLYDGRTNRDALYRRMCGRITYLRDKLLSDLAEAQKIFVYASAGLDGGRMDMLHRALRVFGPVKMLAVQPASASSDFRGSPGDVLTIDGNLYVGFLRRTGRDGDGGWNIAFEDWVSICRKTTEAT